MTIPLFKVIKTGLQTSFQDNGRIGYLKYGVVQGGAMDIFALQIGNILVGNPRNEAGIELCMIGPELEVLSPSTIAICGGDLQPLLNGEELPMWKAIRVRKGDHLKFGKLTHGLRAYITAASGFDIPVMMGSKSYYDRAKIGVAIEKNDTIYSVREVREIPSIGLAHIPEYFNANTIRVILGPHTHQFTNKGIETFFNNTYRITPKADRMGYQLEGKEVVNLVDTADIISEVVPLGGIQVPASGQPIIMMADRQTTGGYARIGTVISIDIPKLAQLIPGTTFHFVEIAISDAQKLFKERELFLRRLEQQVASLHRQ